MQALRLLTHFRSVQLDQESEKWCGELRIVTYL